MKNEWDDYANEWEANPQVVQYSKLAFNSLIKVVNIEGLNILDFGCGTGLLSELMLPSANKIVALDSSKEMTLVLKNKNLPKISVIDIILTKELIRNNELLAIKFDLIVASSVCGFLPNYNETLKLLKSMLTKNGILVQWDWLASSEISETGLTINKVESAFNGAELKLSSLTQPFSIDHDNTAMPVLMAVGKNC